MSPSKNMTQKSNIPEIFPTKANRSSKVNRKVSEFPNCYKKVHRRDSSTAAGLTVSDSATIARRAVESRSERPRFLNGSICRVMYPLCRSWGGVTQRPRLQGVSFLSTLRGGGVQIRRDSWLYNMLFMRAGMRTTTSSLPCFVRS